MPESKQHEDHRCARGLRLRSIAWGVGLLFFLLPGPVSGQTDEEIEAVFWESVECESARQVQAYLEVYPTGRYLAEAHACLEGQLGLNRAARILVQRGLTALNYSPGPADGLFGGATRAAVRQWQRAKGEPVTGYLTRAQADALMEQGREAVARAEAERQRQAEEQRQQAAEAERQAREVAARAEAERQAREREAERQRQEEEARARKRTQPGETFRDCLTCPELVVVPAGTYLMGSPSYETGREEDEGPVHQVTIGQAFAVGKYEVTVGEYRRFVETTGYEGESGCYVLTEGKWKKESERTWRNPGYRQSERDPVVCVSWRDAHAYAEWLSRQTGKTYRLLSEAEWEYVARAGTTTARYWGERETGQCRYVNGADSRTDFDWRIGCDDGYARTAPVGSYQQNGFGLYDVLGNAWEWVQDCGNESYAGAPSDGRAWERGDCGRRVLRGGC